VIYNSGNSSQKGKFLAELEILGPEVKAKAATYSPAYHFDGIKCEKM
jgi:hypothetical protein